MLHARKLRPADEEGAEIVAFPAATAAVPERAFGLRASREPFSFVVDLASEPLGPRWARGAATLALLCGSAFLLAPGFEPLRGAPPAGPERVRNAPLSTLANPMLGEPVAPAVEEPLLPRGLKAGEQAGLRRVSGDVSGGLYWSLRDAGASPQLAADYLKAIATRIDVGEVAPYDRFEFIVDTDGEKLLFAGLRRAQDSDVALMRWTVGGQTGWFSGDSQREAASGLMAPVAGRISSRFGTRVHPILRYSRFHSGVDFAAGWGSPVAAAADGRVVGAGRNGGYGRQVRVAHGGGVVTTYSHLSGFAAETGMPVRQGQVIGYVGSSGLSTGPHLHFEVRVNGRAVDPLSAQLVSRPALSGAELAAFEARMEELRSIEIRPLSNPPVQS